MGRGVEGRGGETEGKKEGKGRGGVRNFVHGWL